MQFMCRVVVILSLSFLALGALAEESVEDGAEGNDKMVCGGAWSQFIGGGNFIAPFRQHRVATALFAEEAIAAPAILKAHANGERKTKTQSSECSRTAPPLHPAGPKVSVCMRSGDMPCRSRLD